MDINANAIAVDISPLYDLQPFKTTINKVQGEFAFTADNEILYFVDGTEDDGFVRLTLNNYALNISTARSYRRKRVLILWTLGRSLKSR